MTERPEQPETNNYLATNFFRLIISRTPTIEYFCQSVNLPSLTAQSVDVPVAQMGLPLKAPVGRYSYENLSVSFLVDEKMENWTEIYNWLLGVSNFDASNTKSTRFPYVNDSTLAGEGIFCDAQLLILSGSYNDDNPVRVITIKDMFPVGISGIQFSSVSVDTEPIIATATFAFRVYTIES